MRLNAHIISSPYLFSPTLTNVPSCDTVKVWLPKQSIQYITLIHYTKLLPFLHGMGRVVLLEKEEKVIFHLLFCLHF